MEIMDASIVGLITSAVCIFLLWKIARKTVPGIPKIAITTMSKKLHGIWTICSKLMT